VRDAEGRGACGAIVDIYYDSLLTSTGTSDDGSYRFDGLNAGAYHLRVEDQPCTSARNVQVNWNQIAVVNFLWQ